MRGTRKKRPKIQHEKSIFSGFLKCSDCGTNLGYHFNQRNHEIKYFNCANNNNSRGCPSTHYVREDFMKEVVIQDIRRLTTFACEYEDDFVKAILGHSMQTVQNDRGKKEKELKGLLARDRELDKLFERIYEDNVTGKITDERFYKMSSRYEQEQGANAKRIKILRKELKDEDTQLVTTDMFIDIVRKYTDATELTQRMVTELIDHIVVYHADRAGEETTQEIEVYYNCIGKFEIPDWDSIPDIDVLLPTRKGVAVSYSPKKAG